MYTNIFRCIPSNVGRTQIYLGKEELDLLDRAGEQTGASRSELIRRAIRSHYAQYATMSQEERLARLMGVAGIWKDRKFTGEEYVRAIRSGDMNRNLRRLGVT
jgi:metal-responsive CopG/Arc/MetJ family transcriptional regulator